VTTFAAFGIDADRLVGGISSVGHPANASQIAAASAASFFLPVAMLDRYEAG
jgi:hypothetical protein